MRVYDAEVRKEVTTRTRPMGVRNEEEERRRRSLAVGHRGRTVSALALSGR